MFRNDEAAAMLVYQTNPVGREVSSFLPQQSLVILDLCFKKTRARKSRDYRCHRFRKTPFLKCFRKPLSSSVSGLKSAFKNVRCRDGFVWTVGPTRELKLRFQISST